MLGSKDPKGRFVRNLRDRGILKCVKIGRNLMFDKKSVDDYIKKEFELQNPKIKIGRSCDRPLETEVQFHSNFNLHYNRKETNGKYQSREDYT